MILYRMTMFLIFERLFKKRFFLELKKTKPVKIFMNWYFESRKLILFFFVKPLMWIYLYDFWKQGIFHDYNYHIILFLILSINIIYNTTFAWFKKREAKELKIFLKVTKKKYYRDVLFDENMRRRSRNTRNFFIYFLTRSYFMFSISFIAYYNIIYHFLKKYRFFDINNLIIKKNKNGIFLKNWSDILISFSFLNYAIITFFFSIIFVYYKFFVENYQTINKTPIIYLYFNLFFLKIIKLIVYENNYYNFFIINVF